MREYEKMMDEIAKARQPVPPSKNDRDAQDDAWETFRSSNSGTETVEFWLKTY